MRLAIAEYLEKELGLQMKDNWQVFRFDYRGKYRFLDFMGFRFYRNRVTLRRSVMLKAARKARKISRKEKITVFDARQMLSYLGWIDATDTYGMYETHIKPFVVFGKLKKKISRYDRNRRENYELVQCREYREAA